MRIEGQERIAEFFGVAPKTIVEWQEQGFPIAVRGGPGVASVYESSACIAWYVERELSRAQVEMPRDRLARVQADRIEMENAERRGQLVLAEQLEPKLAAAFTAAREDFLESVLRLARELPADLLGREAMLREEFEAFLRRLADWGNAGHDGEDEDE